MKKTFGKGVAKVLNEQKIKVMTKLAIYEKNEGKKYIPVNRYFKGDYVGLNMLKTFISATAAFFLIMFLSLFYRADSIMDHLTTINVMKWGKDILMIYLGYLILFMVMAYIVYGARFESAKKSLKTYSAGLKQLQKIYKQEIKMKEDIGGPVQDDEFTGF